MQLADQFYWPMENEKIEITISPTEQGRCVYIKLIGQPSVYLGFNGHASTEESLEAASDWIQAIQEAIIEKMAVNRSANGRKSGLLISDEQNNV